MPRRRYEISDENRARIKDLLPGKHGDPGRTAKDSRRFINAVLRIGRSGAAWRLMQRDTVRLADVALSVGYENYAPRSDGSSCVVRADLRVRGRQPMEENDGTNGLPVYKPVWLCLRISGAPLFYHQVKEVCNEPTQSYRHFPDPANRYPFHSFHTSTALAKVDVCS